MPHKTAFSRSELFIKVKTTFMGKKHDTLEIPTNDPSKYIMDNPILIVSIYMEKSISI